MNKMAVCPKNRRHKEFVTVAHVTEDWVVDGEGNFIQKAEGSESEVVADPDPCNTWTCYICGAEAKFITKGA